MSNTYYENNKEAIIERNKQYYRDNIDDKTKYNQEYYEKHKCAIKENRSTEITKKNDKKELLLIEKNINDNIIKIIKNHV